MNPVLQVASLAENRIYSCGLYESGGADQAPDACFLYLSHLVTPLNFILFSLLDSQECQSRVNVSTEDSIYLVKRV